MAELAFQLDASKLFAVNGLVAVITGGGSGLGLTMAKALEQNGAKKVYIIGRRRESLEAAAKQARHGNIVPIVGDVTSESSLKEVVRIISEDVGYVNLLVANSGIAGPSGAVRENETIAQIQETLWSTPMAEFTAALHTNTTAVFYTAVAFLDLLEKGNRSNYSGGRSQIIATNSIGAFNRKITAGFSYGISKTATMMLMKILSTCLAPYKIRSNVLCPGLFASELTVNLISPEMGDTSIEGNYPSELIPAERTGTPEDVAGAILYLASRAGAYCNGNCVIFDGGKLSLTPATY